MLHKTEDVRISQKFEKSCVIIKLQQFLTNNQDSGKKEISSISMFKNRDIPKICITTVFTRESPVQVVKRKQILIACSSMG